MTELYRTGKPVLLMFAAIERSHSSGGAGILVSACMSVKTYHRRYRQKLLLMRDCSKCAKR